MNRAERRRQDRACRKGAGGARNEHAGPAVTVCVDPAHEHHRDVATEWALSSPWPVLDFCVLLPCGCTLVGGFYPIED